MSVCAVFVMIISSSPSMTEMEAELTDIFWWSNIKLQFLSGISPNVIQIFTTTYRGAVHVARVSVNGQGQKFNKFNNFT